MPRGPQPWPGALRRPPPARNGARQPAGDDRRRLAPRARSRPSQLRNPWLALEPGRRHAAGALQICVAPHLRTSPGSGPTVVWRALAAIDNRRDKTGIYGRRLKCSRLYANGSNGSRTVEGQEMCEQLAASHERKWREEADQWRAVEHAIQLSGIIDRGKRAREEWASDWTTWCFTRGRYMDQVHRMRMSLATADDRNLYTWKRAGEGVIDRLRLLHLGLVQNGTVLGEQEKEVIVLADKGKRDKLHPGAS